MSDWRRVWLLYLIGTCPPRAQAALEEWQRRGGSVYRFWGAGRCGAKVPGRG